MKVWFGVPRLLWAYVVLIPAIGVVICVQDTFDLSKSDWASWVQAVGSILAIVFAWLGIRYQLERSTRLRRDAIVAIAGAAKMRADQVRRFLEGPQPRFSLMAGFHHSIIDGLVNALNGAAVDEIGTPEGVAAFLDMQYQMVLLGVAIEDYVKGPYGDPEFDAETKRLRNQGYDEQIIKDAEDGRWDVLRINLNNRVTWIGERYDALVTSISKI